MKTKILNINRKILIGLFSVVLLATAIPLVFSAPGGNGKLKGNSCMAQCLKVDAGFYEDNSANEEVQNCKALCMPDFQEGTCLVSADGCCVSEVASTDPDCIAECTHTSVTVHVEYSNGNPAVAVDVKIYDEDYSEIAGPQPTDENGDTVFCLEDGTYIAFAFDNQGYLGQSDFFVVPTTTYVPIEIV